MLLSNHTTKTYMTVLTILLLALATSCAKYSVKGGSRKSDQPVGGGNPPPAAIVFEISATPMQVAVGQPVNFHGTCTYQDKVGILNWGFGDTGSAIGFDTTHSYQTVGSFNVLATCQLPGMDPVNKSLVITVGTQGYSDPGTSSCGCTCCY